MRAKGIHFTAASVLVGLVVLQPTPSRLGGRADPPRGPSAEALERRAAALERSRPKPPPPPKGRNWIGATAAVVSSPGDLRVEPLDVEAQARNTGMVVITPYPDPPSQTAPTLPEIAPTTTTYQITQGFVVLATSSYLGKPEFPQVNEGQAYGTFSAYFNWSGYQDGQTATWSLVRVGSFQPLAALGPPTVTPVQGPDGSRWGQSYIQGGISCPGVFALVVDGPFGTKSSWKFRVFSRSGVNGIDVGVCPGESTQLLAWANDFNRRFSWEDVPFSWGVPSWTGPFADGLTKPPTSSVPILASDSGDPNTVTGIDPRVDGIFRSYVLVREVSPTGDGYIDVANRTANTYLFVDDVRSPAFQRVADLTGFSVDAPSVVEPASQTPFYAKATNTATGATVLVPAIWDDFQINLFEGAFAPRQTSTSTFTTFPISYVSDWAWVQFAIGQPRAQKFFKIGYDVQPSDLGVWPQPLRVFTNETIRVGPLQLSTGRHLAGSVYLSGPGTLRDPPTSDPEYGFARVYTAPPTPGTATIEVGIASLPYFSTNRRSSFYADAPLTIVPAPAGLVIVPAQGTISPGQTATFTCRGVDGSGSDTGPVAATWTLENASSGAVGDVEFFGPSSGTSTVTLLAGQTSGSRVLVATRAGLTARATVTVGSLGIVFELRDEEGVVEADDSVQEASGIDLDSIGFTFNGRDVDRNRWFRAIEITPDKPAEGYGPSRVRVKLDLKEEDFFPLPGAPGPDGKCDYEVVVRAMDMAGNPLEGNDAKLTFRRTPPQAGK